MINGEQSLIILKPDAVERHLVGRIISRFEDRGLNIDHMKMSCPTETQINAHYGHLDDNIIQEVCCYMVGFPCIFMVVSGPCCIMACRVMVGSTEPMQAGMGTIRGDFSSDNFGYRYSQHMGNRALRNLIHCSDSQEAFQKEFCIWFPELCSSGDELNYE